MLKRIFPALWVGLFLISCSTNKKQDTEGRTHPRELTETEKQIDAVISKATFQDLNGETVSIEDFAGKVILIDFWETWCGPCLQVFPAMDSLLTEYPNDFAVLAVNTQQSDEPSDVEQFANENPYQMNVLLDVNEIGNQVITLGIPFKVFVDPDGYLIKAELGSAGTEGDYLKAKEIIESYKKS
ncbi:MAG: TlpA disulfide reductase family protein [Bacteroidota bacterium]